MWTKIIGTLLGKGADWATAREARKAQVEALKHEREIEKIRGKIEYEKALTKRASESEGRDHEWELESIRNSGWKDEWVLVVMTIPLVLVFIPFTQQTVLDGFNTLDKTPDWYRFLVTIIYAATFGIRLWRRKFG
jgi:hypothetical protein